MTAPARVIVEADGAARGNPGPAGWGAVVRDAVSGEVLAERSEAIGTATNNVAEYRGLLGGLAAAAECGAAAVEVRMDSKLVIEQMSGRWQIKHPGLRPLAAQAARLARPFEQVGWQWVPRHRNTHADRLANQAMDAAAQGRPGLVEAGPAPTAAAQSGPAPAADRTAGASQRQRASWESAPVPPLRLLLVRHGQTARNAEHRYSGRADVPLSETGVAQAHALAGRITTLAPTVTAVVSSPLARCQDTARVIAAAAGDPPVITEPDLIECDLGEWEGRTYDEVAQRWPELIDGWLTRTNLAAPGGESLQQVTKRVRRAVANLRDTYPPGSVVVVVSHVWPLKVMLRDALAASDALLRRLLLSPAGLSVLDLYPDGALAVPSVNDTAHLPA